MKFLSIRKWLWKSKPYRWYVHLRSKYYRKKFENEDTKLLFLNGLRRSGNHFLVSSIQKSYPGESIFINNRIPNQEIFNVISGFTYEPQKQKNFPPLIILGYEDLSIEEYTTAMKYDESKLKKVKDNLALLIIRDFPNLLASQLSHYHIGKQLRKEPRKKIDLVNNWKQHVSNKTFCTLKYNALLKGEIDDRLLSFLEISSLNISKKTNQFGGGSSFDGVTDSISTQAVLNRYKDMEHDPIYKELLTEELLLLSRKEFNN